MGEVGVAQARGSGLSSEKTLAVVLHGWGQGSRSMNEVCALVREAYGADTRVHARLLSYARHFHSVRAVGVVLNVLGFIDQLIAQEGPFNKIVLVGHSLGATIARRVHLVASGRARRASEKRLISIAASLAPGPTLSSASS
jgi:pimeloyl-ACP methyl ester carboxylesterase